MPNYLWSFQNNNTGTSDVMPQSISLPVISPAGSTSNMPGASIPTSMVNVVRDFYWTYSPVGDIARAETPRIILTERKLRTNALISQLKYSLGQTANGLAQTTQNIQTFTSNTGANGLANFIQSLKTNAQNGANQLGNALSPGQTDGTDPNGGQLANSSSGYANILKNAGTQVVNSISTALADDNNPTVNSSPWLAPYRNLYLTDPTGWVYVLPYFSNNHANQGNAFADSGETGTATDAILKPIAGLATEAAGLFASLNNPTQITYIEKAKFYNYPTEGEQITVEFPLINTGSVSYDDVVKNWQFLFLLLYQNRPGKTSNNVVDQPVIYQVEVPGVKFFPFCYISSLNIDFVGSRREININIPSSSSTSSSSNIGNTPSQTLGNTTGTTSIPAVIPDAYKVSITLNSMIANSKNFMQHMIGPHNLVETGTTLSISTGDTLNAGRQPLTIAPANGILNGIL